MAYGGQRRNISLALLIIANLLPIAGVLLDNWTVAALVVLYWSENLVIGFFTIVKMLTVSPLKGLGTALFFTLHYGGFCAVHGLFILNLLLGADDSGFLQGEPWPLFLVFLQMLIDVVRQVLAYAPPQWLWVFGALFISHGGSYLVNFLFAGERDRTTVGKLMGAPYGRIVVLHVAIIAGGFAVMALGQPIGLLLALIAMKLGLDIKLHLREHRNVAGKPQASTGVIPE